MLAASPMRAADGALAGPANSGSAPKGVVRVDRRTGKLVRGMAPAPGVNQGARKTSAQIQADRARYSPIIDEAARANRVDPLLIDSMIQVESNYNSHAVSRAGAEGLMQLMPPTARMLGVSNSFDPKQNIEAGVRYLKQLQDQYKDHRLALAAYNAGPSTVEKYKFVPPYRETQEYVQEVDRRYKAARQAADAVAAPVVTEPKNEQPAEGKPAETLEHPKLEQFVDAHGRLHLRTAAPR